MADTTGWVWHERFAWHDARGLMDSAPPEALFEPEPSLESGVTKRRLRNLVDASGLLASLVAIEPVPAGDDVLAWVPDPAYVEDIRARSAADGGDAGRWTPFGRGTYDVAAGGCIGVADPWLDDDRTVAAPAAARRIRGRRRRRRDSLARMAEIVVRLSDSGEAYLGLAGPEPPEVRESIALDALEEAEALPALDSMVLDFDFYGRLVGIRVTSAASSALPPALLDAAEPA
jgi:hypothetical protein